MTSQGTLPLSLQGLYGELGGIGGCSLTTAISVDVVESQIWQMQEERALTIRP